jgi:hypothetical protein
MKHFITALYIFIIALGCVIIPIQFYLFYFASCDEVKDNWLIVQTPARCIK